jgi:hypothetical protein
MRDILDKLLLIEGSDPHPVDHGNPLDHGWEAGDYPDPGVDPTEIPGRKNKSGPKLKTTDPATPKDKMHFAGFEIGDEFGISLEEDFEIGTTITDLVEDGIVIDLDEEALEYLAQNGVKFIEGEIVEAHGNDKIYDKCWKGYKKVPGKKRGEEGSCVKKEGSWNDQYTMTGDKSNPPPVNKPAKTWNKDEADAISQAMSDADPSSKPDTSFVGSHTGTGKPGSYVPGTKKTLKNSVNESSDPNLRQADQKTAAVKDPKTGNDWNPYSPNPKGTKKKDPVDDVFGEGDHDAPANPDESRMLETQVEFIKYAVEEIEQYVRMGGPFPEWFQNKIAGVHETVKMLHAYMEGKKRSDEDTEVDEAEYQGRKVSLGKPTRGDVKKFKVYVKNPKGNVVKVNFGDPNMKIKKSNPARRKSFRARHNCDNPGPRHKARYWSCRKW